MDSPAAPDQVLRHAVERTLGQGVVRFIRFTLLHPGEPTLDDVQGLGLIDCRARTALVWDRLMTATTAARPSRARVFRRAFDRSRRAPATFDPRWLEPGARYIWQEDHWLPQRLSGQSVSLEHPLFPLERAQRALGSAAAPVEVVREPGGGLVLAGAVFRIDDHGVRRVRRSPLDDPGAETFQEVLELSPELTGEEPLRRPPEPGPPPDDAVLREWWATCRLP